MISEGSCDTEDLKFSFDHRNNLHWKVFYNLVF